MLAASVWVAAEPIASLRPTNYVNDFAGVLDYIQPIDRDSKAH